MSKRKLFLFFKMVFIILSIISILFCTAEVIDLFWGMPRLDNSEFLGVKDNTNRIVNVVYEDAIVGKAYTHLVNGLYTRLSKSAAEKEMKSATYILTVDGNVDFYITPEYTIAKVPLSYKKNQSIIKGIILSCFDIKNKYFYYSAICNPNLENAFEFYKTYNKTDFY
ncbi:hypothetical protein [Acetivibrio cellulolyticus]